MSKILIAEEIAKVNKQLNISSDIITKLNKQMDEEDIKFEILINEQKRLLESLKGAK